MIGETLRHYRIEAKLGQGGMGVVYKAHDTHLDRFVAIKVLLPERVVDGERKIRFVQEAKAASALNHPNIVHIYDIDSAERVDFMVMEYVAGKTLDQVIGPHGLKLNKALDYAKQIVDGLAAAHAAGIIHRDVKPSNIIVADSGLVKVLDFGLAKLVETRGNDASGTTQTILPETETGTIIGTVAYMSPEQAEGKKLDARSDIFSFGSLLYHIMTGRQPFTADSKLSILARILNDDPEPPSQLRRSIPPEAEKLVLRCLRKDPARRYQAMAELKVALEDIETESTSTNERRRAPLRRYWAWGVLSAAALVIGGFIAWRAAHRPDSSEWLRAVPLTSQPGLHRYPSLSPDGNYVAFTWNGPKQDNPDIYVQQIGSGSPYRRTTKPQNDFNPAWSPDGRLIAFLRRASQSGPLELLLIPPLDGPERKIADLYPLQSEPRLIPPYLAWCPDSKCLLVTDSAGEGVPDALFVITVETGEKRQLTYPRPPVLGDSTPAISPDGRSLAFYRNISSGIGELHWLHLTKQLTPDGESKRLTSVSLNGKYPAWTPDGKEILFSAESKLWRLGAPGGSPRKLAFIGEDGLMPALPLLRAGNIRLVYVRRLEDSNIWQIQTSAPGVPSETMPEIAITSTRGDYTPQFSPDGHRVAFSSNRSGDMEIWESDPDGANATQLTFLAASSLRPHWSPDGRMIVFDSNVEGQFDIYVIPASGGKSSRLTSDPANEQIPSFSRNGRWIYFTSNRTGHQQIWKMPRDGGDPIQVTKNMGTEAYESPDGSHLYYTQGTSQEVSALWRVRLSDGQAVKLFDGVVQRTFAVCDKGIFYFDQPSRAARLRFYDFARGKSATIAQELGNVMSGITVSDDGRIILYCRIDSSMEDLMLVENFQ